MVVTAYFIDQKRNLKIFIIEFDFLHMLETEETMETFFRDVIKSGVLHNARKR